MREEIHGFVPENAHDIVERPEFSWWYQSSSLYLSIVDSEMSLSVEVEEVWR